MSVADGFSALFPGWRTREMRPVALFVALAGGSVRSAGTWGAWANVVCAQTSIVTPKTNFVT